MEEKKKQLLRMAGLGAKVALVEEGRCPTCGKLIEQKNFKDDLSRKEFELSGMCFECQKEVFGE